MRPTPATPPIMGPAIVAGFEEEEEASWEGDVESWALLFEAGAVEEVEASPIVSVVAMREVAVDSTSESAISTVAALLSESSALVVTSESSVGAGPATAQPGGTPQFGSLGPLIVVVW
jgi:hypothetical protein